MAGYVTPFEQVAVRSSNAAEVELHAHLDAPTAGGVGRLGRMAMFAEAAGAVGTRPAFGSRARLVCTESLTKLSDFGSTGSLYVYSCGSVPANGRQSWSVRVLDEHGTVLATSHVVLTCVRPVSALDLALPEPD